jgi:hypothetical protein
MLANRMLIHTRPNDILQIGLKAYDQLFYTQN